MDARIAVRLTVSRWRTLAHVVLAASFLHPINGGGTPYYNVFGFLRPNVAGPGSAGSNPIQYVRTSGLARTMGGTNSESTGFTAGFAPSIGNVIVVPVITYNVAGVTIGVNDNNGNAYRRLGKQNFATYTVSIFAGQVTANNVTPFTVTVAATPGSAKPHFTVQAIEYAGVALPAADSANCATATSGPPTVSVNANAGNNLIFSVVSNVYALVEDIFTTSAEWTMRMEEINNSQYAGGKAVERIVSGGGNYSITYGAADFQWGACIVALQGL